MSSEKTIQCWTLILMYWLLLGRSSSNFFQLVFISWMVTLSSCLIWQIISCILPPKEYGCVYAWTTLGNIVCDRVTADFGNNIILSDEVLIILRVFAINLLRGNLRINTFRILFWCLVWGSNPDFSCNKPTH